MAYEIIFKYYEKIGICDYEKSKELQLKKTFGDLQSEFPMEKLASVILGQMARRDILVFDVEIYEFTKKKISFKENKNGIVIKNKKFNLGLDNIVVCEEELVPAIEQKTNSCCGSNVEIQKIQSNVPHQVPQVIIPAVPSINNTIGNRKPIKRVIFSPSDFKYLQGKSWRFTPNKEYVVYRERFASNGIGMLYLMLDDKDREFEVEDEFFIPAQSNLIGADEKNSFNTINNTLDWQGSMGSMDVPKLR